VSPIHKILLAAALCFRGFAACAENAGSEGVYTPKALTQSTPMRVEVIDGVTFRDIETGLVFRLSASTRVSAIKSPILDGSPGSAASPRSLGSRPRP